MAFGLLSLASSNPSYPSCFGVIAPPYDAMTLAVNKPNGGCGGIWYTRPHMDKFMADTLAWLYSMNGSLITVFGFVIICRTFDDRWYPVHVRTAFFALTWPVWFTLAIPVFLFVGMLKCLEAVVNRFEEWDKAQGEPLRILDAINPRRWRSRAAARGSEAPSP